MIQRTLELILRRYGSKFPAITLLGPRQSGKTTLAKYTFPKHEYVSLEEPATKAAALQDPKKFLHDVLNEHGVIIDEVQNVPDLLSYIQTIIDTTNRPGQFILTGSHNILLNQAISQTLAGRTAILTLLPLSIQELKKAKLLTHNVYETMWHGMYPRLFDQNFAPTEWYPSYIQTYVERDVRQIKNVTNLTTFQRFLGLCAGRIGQILNINALANDCGINVATARGWLSILEMSYITFLLEPHYRNFSKRLIKSPKLYFYDTGLACSLLRIKSAQELSLHHQLGGIFESFIISEFYKLYYNQALRPSLYFWRDSHGHEIDAVIDTSIQLIPLEIKAGQTITSDYFKGLEYWHELTGISREDEYVIYAGTRNWRRTKGQAIAWLNLPQTFKDIIR